MRFLEKGAQIKEIIFQKNQKEQSCEKQDPELVYIVANITGEHQESSTVKEKDHFAAFSLT